MKLLHGLAHTPGTYAGTLALFVAIICYRANPVRSVNRVITSSIVSLAIWQLCVAMGNATGEIGVWVNICLVVGAAGFAHIFVIHDACVYPHAAILQRLRRTRLAWLIVTAYLLGGLCKAPLQTLPPIYPFACRIVTLVASIVAVAELRKQRRAARVFNTHEMLFFRIYSLFVILWIMMFLLFPRQISGAINSALMFVFMGIVLSLLLSERVFDVAGTAATAVAYLLRCVIFAILLTPVVRAASAAVRPPSNNQWDLAILTAILAFPLASAGDWGTRKLFPSFSTTEAAARTVAFNILRAACSESEVQSTTATVAKRYLRGIEVRFRVEDPSGLADTLNGVDVALAARTTRRWLSPEIAVRQFRGAELDVVLDEFAQARIGAVVRYVGRKITVVLFVGQRGGGSKPIVSAELEFMYELATAAGTSIDRLRAIDEMFKSRQLATAGRLAADFSHSARNQIAAILALVEAVKNGDSAQLTPEYRDAVYQETLALAANHNMAAEIARLDEADLNRHALTLSGVIASVTESCGHITRQFGARISTAAATTSLMVAADERLFRQVLLNVLRNALQACAGGRQPAEVSIRTWSDGTSAFIDVTDNGPGVPEQVHDRLFTPWATTKADGTGLGLPFCLEAMRKLQGTVRYLTPRGQAHAWFQLQLPLANSDEFCAAGPPSSSTSTAPAPV